MATRFGTIALLFAAGLFVLLLLRLVMLSLLSKPPATIGLRDGHLAPCPRTPNCVSSQEKRPSFSISPLVIDQQGRTRAVERARQVIASIPGGRVVTIDDGYLHAEFTSRLFRFVDDLELLYDDELPGFHVRSASRVGRSDLGVNRRRVENLRRMLGNGR
jgi:uncharacterized protein (DUF1499 family)